MVNFNVCCSSVCCSLNYYTSILFVLHKCRNFFSVAHFFATIVVFPALFRDAFCCFNFAFCWSTYVRPLFHLVLLGFVTFVSFTLRCQLFFILRCHLFSFINSCVFWYYLSFLLADEACGRNVVNSTACCSLNYYTSILLVLHKCRNFLYVAHISATIVVFSARFGAAFCCFNFTSFWSTYVRPLSHLSLLGFVTYIFWTLRCQLFFILRCHLLFLHRVMRFLILSFISPAWRSLWARRR